jgi:hypothetical protein
MTSRPEQAPHESSVPFNEFLAPDVRGYFKYPSRMQGGIGETIRDAATWTDFWYQLTTHPSQPAASTPAPEIDFAHEMLIAWPIVVVRVPRDDTRRVVFEELPARRS